MGVVGEFVQVVFAAAKYVISCKKVHGVAGTTSGHQKPGVSRKVRKDLCDTPYTQRTQRERSADRLPMANSCSGVSLVGFLSSHGAATHKALRLITVTYLQAVDKHLVLYSTFLMALEIALSQPTHKAARCSAQ